MSVSQIGDKVIFKGSQYRDTRSSLIKFRQDTLSRKDIGIGIGVILLLASIFIPFMTHLLPLLAIVYLLTTAYVDDTMRPPISLPASSGKIDKNNLYAGRTSAAKMAAGLIYLGNDRNRNNAEVWVTVEQAKRHLQGIGTTGSGKTEYIFSIYQGILCFSAALLDLDGKAAADTARQLQILVRRMGREDDLFYENFQTSAAAPNRFYKTSNSTNPLSNTNASGAYNLLVGLISDSGGGNKIFAERAATLADLATNILYDKKNSIEGMAISFDDLSEAITLPSLLESLKGQYLTPETRRAVRNYLLGLNIESPESVDIKKVQTTAQDQHLYAAMHFTRALNSITGAYGKILNTRYGEFNWRDVINHHRILKTMTPSLEKPKQEREYLNNLNVTMLKQSVATFLDYKIAGTRQETNFLPHDNSLSIITFDEANYLLTEGIGLLAGQARSLRFSITVWGQSLSAMRAAHKSEMQEIEDNTGLKLYGAIEDKGAIDDVVFRSGKVSVQKPEKLEGNTSKGYREGKELRQSRIDAIDAQDVKGQLLSEWTLVYKDNPIQLISFYIPELSKKQNETRINEFVHPHDDKALPSDLMLRMNSNNGESEPIAPEIIKEHNPQSIKFTYAKYMKKNGFAKPNNPKEMETIMVGFIAEELKKDHNNDVERHMAALNITAKNEDSIYLNCEEPGDDDLDEDSYNDPSDIEFE